MWHGLALRESIGSKNWANGYIVTDITIPKKWGVWTHSLAGERRQNAKNCATEHWPVKNLLYTRNRPWVISYLVCRRSLNIEMHLDDLESKTCLKKCQWEKSRISVSQRFQISQVPLKLIKRVRALEEKIVWRSPKTVCKSTKKEQNLLSVRARCLTCLECVEYMTELMLNWREPAFEGN